MDFNNLDYKIMKPVAGDDFMQTDLVILYMLEGSVEVECCGNFNHMTKEDILLINSGLEFSFNRAAGAILGMALFPIEVLSRIMKKRRLLLYADSAHDCLHSYQDLKEIFRELTTEYILHNHQTDAYTESLLIRMLDCLIEHYQVTHGKLETTINESDERMQQMMHYIVTHIQDGVNLSDLADEMFVSTSTLSRIFKKNTGVYFADYVCELRVRIAVSLLQGSDQNLTQIAMNCGFSTSAAFNRSFKKIMGTMPSEYRKK